MCAPRLPSITIVIPARNEEARIGQCLDSIHSQDYPGELVEVIVVDDCSQDATREIARRHGAAVIDNGRHDAEFGKMLGLKAAGGELFCYFDADFAIRGTGWLRLMVRPFVEDGSIHSSVTRYYSAPGDPAINRYLNFHHNQLDPLQSYFAPRMEQLIVEERQGYCVCSLTPGRIPPIGGTCIHRRDSLLPLVADRERFLELDFLVLMVRKGYTRFAYVPDAGIYHFHAASFGELLRKRLRNVREVYLRNVEDKEYRWFDLGKPADVLKLAAWMLYAHSLIAGFVVGLVKSVRHRDVAGMYEPLVCLAVTDTVLFGFLFSRKGLRFALASAFRRTS